MLFWQDAENSVQWKPENREFLSTLVFAAFIWTDRVLNDSFYIGFDNIKNEFTIHKLKTEYLKLERKHIDSNKFKEKGATLKYISCESTRTWEKTCMSDMLISVTWEVNS